MQNAPHATATNWLLELDRAISHNDEESLWRAVGNLPDQEAALREVADKIPRLAYQQRGRVKLSEMFLAPLIVPGEYAGVLTDKSVWRESCACITQAVYSWFARTKADVRVFSELRPYDWIGTWRPAVIRHHLMANVPGMPKPSVDFGVRHMELPARAPRLGFIAMVATSATSWLQLTAPDAGVDTRYQMVVGAALQRSPEMPMPIALAPARIQDAVAEGLGRWLDELQEAVGIVSWTTFLQPGNQDLVRIALQLDDMRVPHTQFNVRMHQVGMDGLTYILHKLGQIAPMLDQPMDLPQRTERVVLPLT